jgi:hypothetical protein
MLGNRASGTNLHDHEANLLTKNSAGLRLANTLRGWCSAVRAREQPAGVCYGAGAGTSKSRSWRAKVL